MFEAVASKAAILALAAHCLMLLLRRRSAAERHLVWVLTFLAILALPWMERTAPAVVVLDSPIATTIAASAAPEVPIQPSTDWAHRIWLAGCVSIALYQMAGIVLLIHRRRFLRPFPAPQSPARVYTSPHANVPMTWGMLRPVIVLPESAVEWPAERLRIVLLHESAHIARFDFATQLLARLVCALHWFNPLLWLGAAAMRREQEQACDNAVLKLAVKGSDYAQLLLDLATNKRLPTLSIPMAQTNNLESRIRAALDPARSRQLPTLRLRAGFAAIAACLLLALVVVKTQAQGSARLSGSVLDISGAAVPRTEVQIVFAKGRREITRSEEDGKYAFSGLPEGTYSIEARKPGFALLQLRDVSVQPGEARQLDLKLQLGRINETLDIVGKKPPVTAVPLATTTPKRIRVGGSVQASKLLEMPKPQYPQHLQQQGVEGTVLLEGVISTEGKLLSVRNLNTMVHAELIQAATAAIQQWRYQPTLLNGVPVEVITTITVNYKLAP